MARVVRLATPPVARLVPDGVFDAFAWCESDELEWRAPDASWDDATPIAGSDTARMVFVTRPGAAPFLPRELACLHAFGLGLTDEDALAPWAIDDATDELYAHRVRPGDALWLAADNLNALFWGLHDWAHFHNHGPFEQRAWTELQCDAAALAWTWANREAIGLDEARAIFAQPKTRRGRAAAGPLRELGPDPDTQLPVVVRDGRFGPYVTDGTTNASLRKGDNVESITIERASELLAERRAAGPRAPRARGAKKAPAKKAAAKKAAKRLPAKKRAPAKKAAAKRAVAARVSAGEPEDPGPEPTDF